MEVDRKIVFTTKGVHINGTFIDYTADLQDIGKSEIDTLSIQNFDAWNGFLLLRSISLLRDDILTHHICPVNVPAIEQLIDKKIDALPLKAWSFSKKVLAAIALILGVVLSIFNIIMIWHKMHQ